jgi:hypothetical protein
MKVVLDLHQIDYRKPKAISTLIVDAFKQKRISGKQAAYWYTQHTATHLVQRLWLSDYYMENNPRRDPRAHLIDSINNNYSLPEMFHYWFEKKRREINDDKNISLDVKRLVNL